MANWTMVRRVLTPMPVVQLYYYWKFRARISRRAEVELSPAASWGPDCVIAAYTKVKIPGPFTMGRGVRIASGCFVDSGWAGLTIGDDTEIGPNCTVVAVSYRTDRLDQPLADQGLVTQGIHIGRRVRLGPGCVVLDGAEIGDDEVVPPGTVVRGRYSPGRGKRLTPSRVIVVDP
jgi:acetyltransferase-like isoleucine patch superfamily enzyme